MMGYFAGLVTTGCPLISATCVAGCVVFIVISATCWWPLVTVAGSQFMLDILVQLPSEKEPEIEAGNSRCSHIFSLNCGGSAGCSSPTINS